MVPRDFTLFVKGYYERRADEEDAKWNRAILIANELRALQKMQAKHPSQIKWITLENLKKDSKTKAVHSRDPIELRREYLALCDHIDRIRATGVRRVLSVQKVGKGK